MNPLIFFNHTNENRLIVFARQHSIHAIFRQNWTNNVASMVHVIMWAVAMQSAAMQMLIQCTPRIATRDSRDTAQHVCRFRQWQRRRPCMLTHDTVDCIESLQRSLTHNFHSLVAYSLLSLVIFLFCTPNAFYYNRTLLFYIKTHLCGLFCTHRLHSSAIDDNKKCEKTNECTRNATSVRFGWTRSNALWSPADQFAILIRNAHVAFAFSQIKWINDYKFASPKCIHRAFNLLLSLLSNVLVRHSLWLRVSQMLALKSTFESRVEGQTLRYLAFGMTFANWAARESRRKMMDSLQWCAVLRTQAGVETSACHDNNPFNTHIQGHGILCMK